MVLALTELSKGDVDTMVNKIAASVRPFALDVRRGVFDDGKMYIAIVNTVRNAQNALLFYLIACHAYSNAHPVAHLYAMLPLAVNDRATTH